MSESIPIRVEYVVSDRAWLDAQFDFQRYVDERLERAFGEELAGTLARVGPAIVSPIHQCSDHNLMPAPGLPNGHTTFTRYARVFPLPSQADERAGFGAPSLLIEKGWYE